MTKHSLTLPDYHPPSLNSFIGKHWSKLSKAKLEAETLLRFYAIKHKVPDAKVKRSVAIVVTLCGRQKRADADNLTKVFLDACVRSKLLVDDGPDWVEWRGVEWQRGTRTSTVVLLEDLA